MSKHVGDTVHKSTDVFILRLQAFGFSAAVRCIWDPGCHNNQQGMLWEFPLSVTLECLIGLEYFFGPVKREGSKKERMRMMKLKVKGLMLTDENLKSFKAVYLSSFI